MGGFIIIYLSVSKRQPKTEPKLKRRKKGSVLSCLNLWRATLHGTTFYMYVFAMSYCTEAKGCKRYGIFSETKVTMWIMKRHTFIRGTLTQINKWGHKIMGYRISVKNQMELAEKYMCRCICRFGFWWKGVTMATNCYSNAFISLSISLSHHSYTNTRTRTHSHRLAHLRCILSFSCTSNNDE